MVGAAPLGCLLCGEEEKEEAEAAGEWKLVSGPACVGQRRGKGGDPKAGAPQETKRGRGIPEPSTLRGWRGGCRLRPPLGVMAPL